MDVPVEAVQQWVIEKWWNYSSSEKEIFLESSDKLRLDFAIKTGLETISIFFKLH